MISTNDKYFDKILTKVNNDLKNRKIEDCVPFLPMLRVQNDKLYYGILISGEKDNVWKSSPKIKAKYWALFDINNLELVEFNKTSENDYSDVIKTVNEEEIKNQKEMSEYEINKKIQYMEYFMNDIKNDSIPIQKDLNDILDNKITIDGQEVNATDYLMANIEEEIEEKVKELVNLVIEKKYNSISFYYECLIEKIVDIYKNTKKIDKEKINAAIKIMNKYYGGVTGIRNFFNI